MKKSTLVQRSACVLVLVLAIAKLGSTAQAQPVLTNGDFSANANQFTYGYGFAGEVSNSNPTQFNAATITGWTETGANFGINSSTFPPQNGLQLADNGAPQTPDVAFMQGAGTFSQTVTGLVANDSYAITFDYNARNFGGAKPTFNVSIGGTSQTLANVQPVGGSNPYYAITVPFTATSNSQTLTFTTSNTTGQAPAADYTTLLNNVAIKPVSIVTVQNPSFEANGSPAWPGYSPITGWQSTGGVGINPAAPTNSPIAPFGPSISQNGLNVPDGSHFAFMQDDGNSGTSGSNPAFATLSQTIHGLTVNDQYTINFFDAERSGDGAGISLAVYMGSGLSIDGSGNVTGGSSLASFNPSNVEWTPESVTFTATASDETLIFQSINVIPGNPLSDLTLDIDGVSIIGPPPVPEPSSLVALGGLGAMGLVLALRRRRRTAALSTSV